MRSGHLLRSFGLGLSLLLWLLAFNVIPHAMGEDSVIIDSASAIVSNVGIEHSATFTNLLDALITFDALIRLDTQDEVLMLDARTITLGPRNSITIEGIFAVTQPGSYLVRWEALSPPPGEALAAVRQVTIEIVEEVPRPPPEEPEELPDPGEQAPLPDEPVPPEKPVERVEDEPVADNQSEEEPPADQILEEPVDPLADEPPPADPLEESPELVIGEPAADPFPLDPEAGVSPPDPALPPAPEEPARDKEAPLGDAAIVPPGGELPDLSPPAPPAPAPPPRLAGNSEDQATNSAFNDVLIVAIGIVIWASIMGIILRRRSQNWKYEPIFTDA